MESNSITAPARRDGNRSSIPAALMPDVVSRRSAGQTSRQVAAWLTHERLVPTSHGSVDRLLHRHARAEAASRLASNEAEFIAAMATDRAAFNDALNSMGALQQGVFQLAATSNAEEPSREVTTSFRIMCRQATVIDRRLRHTESALVAADRQVCLIQHRQQRIADAPTPPSAPMGCDDVPARPPDAPAEHLPMASLNSRVRRCFLLVLISVLKWTWASGVDSGPERLRTGANHRSSDLAGWVIWGGRRAPVVMLRRLLAWLATSAANAGRRFSLTAMGSRKSQGKQTVEVTAITVALMPARRHRHRLILAGLGLLVLTFAAWLRLHGTPSTGSASDDLPEVGVNGGAADLPVQHPSSAIRAVSSGQLHGVVVTSDGEPAPGADVSIQPEGAKAQVNQVLTTDAAGLFTARSLADGVYTVLATRAGLVSDRVRGIVGAGVPELELRLKLEAGASLAGTVRDATDGSTLAGCLVTTAFGQSISCDHAGRFILGPLSPGDVPLRVGAAGYAPRDVTVSLTRRTRASADVALTRGASVAGTVLDPDHKPFRGARIRSSHYALDGAPPAEVETTSDAKGRFTLDGVAPGRATFQATASGYAETAGVELLLLSGDHREGVELTLTTGGAIAGRVLTSAGQGIAGAQVQAIRLSDKAVAASTLSTNDGAYRLDGLGDGDYTVVATSNGSRGVSPNLHVKTREETNADVTLGEEFVTGRVVTSSGAPVAGAVVIVVSSMSSGQGQQATSTDGAGKFRVDGLVGAPYRVQAKAEGKGSVEVRGVAAKAQVELVLAGVGRIEGVVTDRQGHGIESFEVKLVPRDEHQAGSVEGRFRTRRLVSPDGSFSFDDVPTGKYEVRASTSGRVEAEQQAEVTADTAAHVALTLDEGVTVSGKVLLDGAPAVGCEVHPGSDSPSTDANGAFRLTGVEPDNGRVFVWARCPDGAVATGLTTVEGEQGEIVLTAKMTHDQRFDRANVDFGGVGISLRTDAGQVIAARVFEGGPAFVAGVQNGDIILSVDGWPTGGAALQDVVDRIRGPLGMPVVLGIVRPSTGAAFPAYAERDRIVAD
jgi:hypothetical protein